MIAPLSPHWREVEQHAAEGEQHEVGRLQEDVTDAHEGVEGGQVARHVQQVRGLGADVALELERVQEHGDGGGAGAEDEQEVHVVLLLGTHPAHEAQVVHEEADASPTYRTPSSPT